MKKLLPLMVVIALLFVVQIASANDVAVKAKTFQVSGVVGTLGIGAAAYWPVAGLTEYGVTVGPMVAVGTEAVAGGAGVQIDVSLDFPILEQINFAWGGYGYNWVARTRGWEFGFGKSWEVK